LAVALAWPAEPVGVAQPTTRRRRVVYKPALNFTGDDQFEVQTLYANGQVVEYSYHVKVVGPSKGGRADIRP
jgi:hypothetical protein